MIVAKGNIGDSRIVVCKRPDRRGLTYNKVEEMAETVAKFINCKGISLAKKFV